MKIKNECTKIPFPRPKTEWEKDYDKFQQEAEKYVLKKTAETIEKGYKVFKKIF